ncbi:hypothetical protein [Marinifilum sp. D737]|uniref:hypothetical protein n=1 Tax=Marinifilum sp. D737 TaxID=2969628 RepID=UPI002272DAC0|nr:hypothetical protein [Marinifilum sp. D737]MCY1633653.1 hypothetical protein [Marinifilum sp. D737]
MNKIILGIILGTMLCSCSYKNIYTLKKFHVNPLQSEYHSGYSEYTADKYKIQLKYISRKEDKIDFEAIITNTSKDTIFIDPSLFYYKAYRKTEINSYNHIQSYSCINSDSLLQKAFEVKQQLSHAKNPYSKENYTTSSIITEALVAGFFESLSGSENEDDEYESREEMEANWVKDRIQIVTRCDETIDYLQNEAILNTSLAPKNMVKGKLRFTLILKAKRVKFYFPVAECKTSSLIFDQQAFYK